MSEKKKDWRARLRGGLKKAQKGARAFVEGWEKARDYATEAERRGYMQADRLVFGEGEEKTTVEAPERVSRVPVAIVSMEVGDVKELIGLPQTTEKKTKKQKKKQKEYNILD